MLYPVNSEKSNIPGKELLHPILVEQYCKPQAVLTLNRFCRNHPCYLELPVKTNTTVIAG